MEVPSALPGSQPPPRADTALAAPPATPTSVMGRGRLSFTYPGAMDGVVKVRSFRGQQQPATINGFGLQRNSTETLTHSTKQLNTDQHRRESMVRDHGKLQQPQHEGSCVSSASRTQANSAFPVQGTWCLMATRGVTHTVCQRDCDEDSGGGKTPATNSKHSCSCMAPCPEHQPPGYCRAAEPIPTDSSSRRHRQRASTPKHKHTPKESSMFSVC